MTQDKPERSSTGLSPAQVAGSALAAVSAAVFASFAGTTGTIIGAALGSVVATVGSAAYTWWLRRTTDVVRRTAAQVRQTALLTGPLPRSVAQGPLREDDQAGQAPDLSARAEAETEEERVERERSRLPWGKALLASAAVMIAALGGITVVEAVTGKPMAAWFGKDSGDGTSVGHLVGSDSKSTKKDRNTENPKNDTKPTPTKTATPTPTPSAAPTQTPTPTDLPSAVPQQTTTPAAPQASTAP